MTTPNSVPVLHDTNRNHADAGPTVAKPRKAANYTIEHCKNRAARILGIALASVRLTRRATADACGVSKTLVDRWLSEEPRTIPLGRILVMASTSARGRDAARAVLTAALADIDDTPPTSARRDIRGMVDDLHAEVGEFAAEWRAAMADGEIEPDEAKRLVAEVHDVEIVCARIRREAEKYA